MANRDFLVRAVRFLAEQGIRQFLDRGTGIPTSPNVSEVARQAEPKASDACITHDSPERSMTSGCKRPWWTARLLNPRPAARVRVVLQAERSVLPVEERPYLGNMI